MPKVLPIDKYAGELQRVVLTVNPAAAAAGWVVKVRACKPPPGAAAPPVANPAAGRYEFAFDTTGWPKGSYHFQVWRESPDPEVLVDVPVSIRVC